MLINPSKVKELKTITVTSEGIEVGATTTINRLREVTTTITITTKITTTKSINNYHNTNNNTNNNNNR